MRKLQIRIFAINAGPHEDLKHAAIKEHCVSFMIGGL